MAEHGEINAVVAHSMLGTIAAARGSIETVLAHDLDAATIESLLLMAMRRLDVLADRVRAVAMGFPDEVLTFMEDLHAREKAD
ncbi:MAG TPA: hypothetical protein VGJ03_15395 [Acidimicrobiales bacterium]|jgi:hypothetical protein